MFHFGDAPSRRDNKNAAQPEPFRGHKTHELPFRYPGFQGGRTSERASGSGMLGFEGNGLVHNPSEPTSEGMPASRLRPPHRLQSRHSEQFWPEFGRREDRSIRNSIRQ